MRYIFLFYFLSVGLVLVSCKKQTTSNLQPEPRPSEDMVYIPLNDAEVKYQSRGVLIDLNKDERDDLLFEVQRVGDPISKEDKFRYTVVTSIFTSVPVNRHEQIPMFRKEVRIPINDFGVYSWYGGSEITLYEKVLAENGSVTWMGNWLVAHKNYLPVQVRNYNNQRFIGWVEVTADAAGERLILHRAAICKIPEVEIEAGL